MAYLVSQTAIMGYLARRNFEWTAAVRRIFLDAYENSTTRRLNRTRLGLYMAAAFLQSLHFELSILHTGNAAIVEPWLHTQRPL